MGSGNHVELPFNAARMLPNTSASVSTSHAPSPAVHSTVEPTISSDWSYNGQRGSGWLVDEQPAFSHDALRSDRQEANAHDLLASSIDLQEQSVLSADRQDRGQDFMWEAVNPVFDGDAMLPSIDGGWSYEASNALNEFDFDLAS